MGIFGFFNKNKKETLDKGLEKTKTSVFDKLARAVAGKSKVDDDVLDNLEEVLITSDVGVDTTLKIIRRIEERVARDKYVSTSELNGILRDEIAALLAENNTDDNDNWDLPSDHRPYVILVVGVNGVGKTTTIGKLAWQFKNAGKKVYLGDFSYVGRRTVVGDYTKIYENVYIGDDVKIGSKCIIYPGVRIYPGMEIGNNVIIHSNAVIGADGFGFAPLEDGTYKKIEHTGNVVIGDDVEIGANTTIDKSQMGSTVIGKGVKIDNLCQIAHNVEIGENTVIAAQSGIAGSTKIGSHCVFGGQVGVAGHITIADNTSFGAQSGVLGSIRKGGQAFLGTPAIPYRDYLKCYAVFKKAGSEK